jgi:hypothetical protein
MKTKNIVAKAWKSKDLVAKARKPMVGLLRPRPKPVKKYRKDRAKAKRNWKKALLS